MTWSRKNKFGAVKVKEDGHTFDSKAEHRRYLELKLMQQGKAISDLAVHVRFPLEVKGERIAVYEGDFVYRENGRLVCEDVKGVRTDTYRIKSKLFRVLHPDCDFREIAA